MTSQEFYSNGSMHVFVTGATGFIGFALVRRLLEDGHHVRALVRPTSSTRWIDGYPMEKIEGDLGDPEALRLGMAGCDWVFHVAALYSYWGHSWEDYFRANVEGTRHVMEMSRELEVSRVVYTSSVSTLGFHQDHSPADEDTPSTLQDRIGPYQRSKFLAEQVVMEFARQGLPVVIVNPSTPVGVGDHKPTPTGQIIVDFLNGRMFGYLDTGLNLIDVEDVAAGHLLAAKRGRGGERYILGNRNLNLKQLLDLLAQVSGQPPVRLRIPYQVALAWSYLDSFWGRLNPYHIPTATPQKVRLAQRYEFFDPSKAIRELGLPQTPVQEALRKAVQWYRENGYAP